MTACRTRHTSGGVNFGDDAVCWTDDFVIEQGNVVNAEVGGHPRRRFAAHVGLNAADGDRGDALGLQPAVEVGASEERREGGLLHQQVGAAVEHRLEGVAGMVLVERGALAERVVLDVHDRPALLAPCLQQIAYVQLTIGVVAVPQ